MQSLYLKPLTPELEERIRRNPSLNVDSFILPSPFAADDSLEKNYDFSLVWEEEREILGYLEVWSNPGKTRLHIYKQVTSPFGRGKGIGSAFLERLGELAPPAATIEIHVWERQTETLAFFRRRGFAERDRTAWRALSFIRMEGRPAAIRELSAKATLAGGSAEELGKIRHDAKKAIRLLADMAGNLTAENCSRIIEDINRETTALVNTLNLFRDSTQRFRTVNIKDLIIDRIIPMVEHSPVSCELRLRFGAEGGEARANYLDAGRAVVNLVSNALDAIRAANRPGVISIGLDTDAENVILTIEDNGIGMAPERLASGADGLPLFVGKTTKAESGEGQGTRQIFATFGANNISLKSEAGKGSAWTIRMDKAAEHDEALLVELETRWQEFRAVRESDEPDAKAARPEIEAFIWRKRKLEILVWDLILQFARRNNVRELYRDFLAFRHDLVGFNEFRDGLQEYRTEHDDLRRWLADAARRLKRADLTMDELAPLPAWAAPRFTSYAQAVNRTVIFTLDPTRGVFGATDRKLAEHADYVPYLGGSRDRLLRGEFFGDLLSPATPVQLGVWELGDEADGRRKAALMRQGARWLLSLGLPPTKPLLFYETTWRRGGLDFDVNRKLTLALVARLEDHELGDILVANDDEAGDYIFSD